MSKVLFLDFYDSFTFNLVQELDEIGLDVKVISWQDFTSFEDEPLLVLGPGPGHPDDYSSINHLILNWIDKGKSIFAVCLGHQLIWKLKGLEIVPSVEPLHGQSILMPISETIEEWLGLKGPLIVQRYNSLAVKFSATQPHGDFVVFKEEVMIAKSNQIISYQFHPESLGTKCRKSFFLPILKDLL